MNTSHPNPSLEDPTVPDGMRLPMEDERGRRPSDGSEETSDATAADGSGDADGPQEKRRGEAGRVLEQIKSNTHEGDEAPVASLTLRKILGGDILSADMVRSQVWLLLLIVLFIIVGVAFRYQCQQDSIRIVQLQDSLVHAKYQALNSASKLTELSRESRILERLKAQNDSTLHISTQPPFIVVVEDD